MSKNELKVEEPFLNKAIEGGVTLRFSLANRERLTGTISQAGRYDITLESEGRAITIPKKEIFHISPSVPLLDVPFQEAAGESDASDARSRVQNEFLGRFVKEKTLALLSMTNGDEIRGVLEGYDGFTLALKTSRGQVLLYKHGLCSIGPGYRRRTGREDARQPA